jgi:hypothetical protein
VRAVARSSGGAATTSGGGLAPAVAAMPMDHVRVHGFRGLVHRQRLRGGREGGPVVGWW